MPSIALFEPEIPGNAGAVGRVCAATHSPLHLIGRLGFSFQHPKARRAAMDYWQHVHIERHINFDDFQQAAGSRTIWAFSTRATREYWDVRFGADDILLFGPESRGLPESILASLAPRVLTIPMAPEARSLNLSTAVAIALYESLRQTRSSAPAL